MKVLLVGNGINQLAGIVPGWDQLFAQAVKIEGFQVKRSLSPTLEYELNIQTILDADTTKKAGDIKRDIANYIRKLQAELPAGWENKIHKTLMDAAPEILLTTNYDYFLEQAADPDFQLGKPSTRETLYSRERYRDAGAHRIYHIHGEIAVPSSICLGYEQYVGSVQNIRAELTKGAEEKKNAYHLYAVLKGLEKPVPNRWYYHFFTDDLYILGFGLDAAEQDIWWLLNYRAEQMRTHPGLITNKITYLETSSAEDSRPGCTWADVEAGRVAFEDFLKAHVRYEANKRILEQKKTLLEAFRIKVEDCTDPGDAMDGADVGTVFAKRYRRALEHLEGGEAK